MAEVALEVEVVPVDVLVLDPVNVRRHGERNIDAIMRSLVAFGQRRPLVVRGDTVVAGNGTLEAARRLGWPEVAITRVPDDWTVEQARAFAVADNRTAELAEWDGPGLLDTLQSLDGDLLGAAGFDDADLADLSRIWGRAPDLDDLHDDVGDPTVEDGLVVIRFRVPPDIAQRWEAAVKATGLDGVEAVALAVQAAFDGLTDGVT